MRLEQSFEVPVPIAQAWSVLLDVEQIAPCMPGATLTGYDGTAFTGLVKVKLGPVVMSFKGNGQFVERDESARRVVIQASGQETKGAGAAQARVTAELREDQGGAVTQVNVVADVDVAGRAAQFGRGMIADVNRRLVQQFADCLAKTIAAMPAAPVEAAPAASAPAEAALIDAAPAEVAAPAAEAAPSPAPAPAAAPTPAAPLARPIEAEPIDLLAVTGAKGMARRAGPIIAVVLIIAVAIVVFFALS